MDAESKQKALDKVPLGAVAASETGALGHRAAKLSTKDENLDGISIGLFANLSHPLLLILDCGLLNCHYLSIYVSHPSVGNVSCQCFKKIVIFVF